MSVTCPKCGFIEEHEAWEWFSNHVPKLELVWDIDGAACSVIDVLCPASAGYGKGPTPLAAIQDAIAKGGGA